jgi:hypothetical protein
LYAASLQLIHGMLIIYKDLPDQQPAVHLVIGDDFSGFLLGVKGAC